MLNILDTRWQLFLRVADLGSISRASLALDLPQSVISRQISQLESDAGERLFRRTGRGVVLTEFGEQVYPRITALVREAEQLADDMRTRSGLPMGDVSFGMLPSTVPLLTGPISSEIRVRWPQVRLHLAEGSSAQLEEWLVQGRLDLALLLREEDSAGTDESPLARLPLDLVVPADHPIALRDTIAFDEVATLPLVLPGDAHPLRARLASLAKEKDLSLQLAVQADSIRLQHEIVATGGGFAITAGFIAPKDQGRLVAVRIVQPTLTRAIVLGVTSHRPHTRATRAVAELIRETASVLLKSEPS